VRFLLVLMLLWASTAQAAPAGKLIIIGGGLSEDNAAIWQAIVEAAGGPGAEIAVIGAASEDPKDAADRNAARLARYGAKPLVVPLGGSFGDAAIQAEDKAWAAKLRAADGVFFTGGAQARIVEALTTPRGRDTALLAAMRALYRNGGVIAGTSAGAAIMSHTMFWDPRDQADMLADQAGLRWKQDIGPGLGFLDRGILVDQHFLARNRLPRLMAAMRQQGIIHGWGVEEDTALVFEDKTMTVNVIGKADAVVLRCPKARTQPTFTCQFSLLSAGDRFYLFLFDQPRDLALPLPARNERTVWLNETQSTEPGVVRGLAKEVADGALSAGYAIARKEADTPQGSVGTIRLSAVPNSAATASQRSILRLRVELTLTPTPQ
jgi:cyanophycinase